MNPSIPTTTAGGTALTTRHGRSLDDRITEMLRGCPYPGLRIVTCQCESGIVTLDGRVSSFHLKQMAQTLVGNLDGVERVHNRIEVAEHSEASFRGDGDGP
jgi:osmotically-inducible protein OsmY